MPHPRCPATTRYIFQGGCQAGRGHLLGSRRASCALGTYSLCPPAAVGTTARAPACSTSAPAAAAAERAALREIRGFKRSPSQAVSPPVTTCHHSVALQSPVPGTVQPVFNMPRACSWPAGAGAHWSAGVGIVSMSLAVVLLAPPASGAAAPLGAAAPPAPAAAAPPALPAADAAARSGTLKSFTARYSSRILHAIFARWLRALPALQSQADAGAACTCTAL